MVAIYVVGKAGVFFLRFQNFILLHLNHTLGCLLHSILVCALTNRLARKESGKKAIGGRQERGDKYFEQIIKTEYLQLSCNSNYFFLSLYFRF